MIEIGPYQAADRGSLVAFVEAIQEHERASTPGLKPGSQIGASYADLLLTCVAERNGVILMARVQGRAIGFIGAWLDTDDDPLLEDAVRGHGYISDIYVEDACRRTGVASALLAETERRMRERGCKRIRVCAKATNAAALAYYRSLGYSPYEVVFSKDL